MPGSDENRSITGWKSSSMLYRRPPGLGWLLALVAVPPLLGLIGWGGLDTPNKEVGLTLPTVNPSATLATPTMNAPNVNLLGLSFAPLSIVRNGNDISLSGDLPDDAEKASLLAALRRAFGPGINLTDDRNINVGVSAPDFSELGSLFTAARDVPDFIFDLNGDTLTLAGIAPSGDGKAAIDAAASLAWPNLKITNSIQVQAAPAPTVPAGPAPAPGLGRWRVGVAAGEYHRPAPDADHFRHRRVQPGAGVGAAVGSGRRQADGLPERLRVRSRQYRRHR